MSPTPPVLALLALASAPVASVSPVHGAPGQEVRPSAPAAAGWPSWRGPLRSGQAVGADPPLRWSEGENVAWKAALPGHGKSTPIVVGDRIFLQAARPTREASAEELAALPAFSDQLTERSTQLMAFLVLALERETGEPLWESQVTERVPVAGAHESNGYASFSPVADETSVYASFGSYGVYALDAASGAVRWSYELGPQRMRRGWGEGGAPALEEETLVVVADQEDASFVVALDTTDGTVRWRRERDEPSTWTSPLIVRAVGATQVVVNGTTAVRSYDLATGDVLWSCSGQTLNAIPSPVSDGRLVVATSGYRGSACLGLSLAGRGDLRQVEGAIAWSRSDGTPYVPSPLLADGRLYLLAGNTGRLSILDVASGEVLLDRQHLDLGSVYASPIEAAGRVYVVGRDGTTLVLSREGELLATNSLEDPLDASPAAVGGALYLRSDRHLYAIGKP